MSVLQILSLIGVPSLSAALILYVVKRLRDSGKKMVALEKGIQALLRAQMINDYNKWIDKHYAPVYAKENFENMWRQYHDLGANGVMDGIHGEFIALPTNPPED